MPATALLKFSQGISIGANGEAFIASTGTSVTIANSNNTDVASWRIELLYGPPGSSFEQVPGTPLLLAENAASATPTIGLTPEALFYGCYRIRLSVWDAASFSGTLDTDIRNIAVPTPNKKLILSPFQKRPDPLPLLGTGDPGEKPHELNFEGQPWGWAGGDYNGTSVNFRLINDALVELDTVAVETVFGRSGPAISAVAGDYDTDAVTNVSTKPGVTLSDALDGLGRLDVQTFTGAGPHPLTGLGAGSKLIALIDTSGGAVTVQLPATLVDGEVFEVWDASGDAGSNNITVDGNGNTINGSPIISGGYGNKTFAAHTTFLGGGYFVG